MAWWLRRVSGSKATRVLFQQALSRVLNLSAAHWPFFAWHWASQCTDTRTFKFTLLHSAILLISSVAISRWQGFNLLNMNMCLPLFWSTWIQAWGQDSLRLMPPSWAWLLLLYSLGAKVIEKALPLFLNMWKTVAHPDFFKPHLAIFGA